MLSNFPLTLKDQKAVEFETTIKKSRFICHLKRIHSEEEGLAFIQLVKKQHYKANHNCSALVFGTHDEIQRAFDDGEPSGTAGIPMLEVIRKNDLHDVVVVVTRYFGGIKLGAGGLIRAYAGSVADALKQSDWVQIIPQQELILQLDYPDFNSLEHFFEQKKITSYQVEYSDKVKVNLFINLDIASEMSKTLLNLLQGRVQITTGEEKNREIDFNH